MATKIRRTTGAEADAILNKPLDLTNAEIVTKAPNLTAPISLRLSAPLLERLDRWAEDEGRSRSNLIQFLLWDQVRKRKDNVHGKR